MPRFGLPRTARQRRATLLVVVGLVGFVGAVYVVVVLGGSLLLGRTSSPHPALSIGATVLVALAFDPVQRRLDRWASRLTHGGERSPYEVLTSLSETLGSTYAVDDLPARIARVLVEGTGARWAGVWLVVGGELTPAATWPPGADVDRGPPPSGPGVRTTEVRHAGDVLGVLVLREAAGQPLTPVEERLVAGLTAQVGLVLRGVRLRAEREQRLRELAARAEDLQTSQRRLVAAREAERRRLERDIHDGAQQHLVALTVNLRLAQAVAARSPARSAELLDVQATAARQTVDTVLSLARGIYPDVLTDRGLPAALAAAARAGAVPVEVQARDVARYPPEVEAAVYFSCLEALQNAAKHAGADRVRVVLAGGPDELRVTVDDDGRGFPREPTTFGAGLANIRDRIDAVGGAVELGAAPGGGARVALRVPLTTGRA